MSIVLLDGLCYNGPTMSENHAGERPAFPLDSRQVRQNHRLGILNGVFIQLAMALTNPGMVLTVLVRELVEAGIPADRADTFCCPIGLGLGTNQPGEIAVSVVGQLIGQRDRWRAAAGA